MNFQKIIKKYSRFNFFILAVITLLAFSFIYFLYYRYRSQADVYAIIMLTRPPNMLVNAPYNWVPSWLGNSIEPGDRDVSPIGGTNAIVLEKDSFDFINNGQVVSLLLKVKAVKDRTGVYLFKNKPLSVGMNMIFNFTKTSTNAIVTSIGTEMPNYDYKKLTIKAKGRLSESSIFDKIRVGDEIKNSRGDTLAKIVAKNIAPADVRFQVSGISENISYSKSNVDLQLTIDLLSQKIDETFYFPDNQIIKLGEYLFLSFPTITLLNYQITDIQELN